MPKERYETRKVGNEDIKWDNELGGPVVDLPDQPAPNPNQKTKTAEEIEADKARVKAEVEAAQKTTPLGAPEEAPTVPVVEVPAIVEPVVAEPVNPDATVQPKPVRRASS